MTDTQSTIAREVNVLIQDVQYVVLPDGHITYNLTTSPEIPQPAYSTNPNFLNIASIGVGDVFKLVFNEDSEDLDWIPVLLCDNNIEHRVLVADLEVCPICGEKVYRSDSDWTCCLNELCPAKIDANVQKFIAMCVRPNFSEIFADPLTNNHDWVFTLAEKQYLSALTYTGKIKHVADLFTLDADDIAGALMITSKYAKQLIGKINNMKGNITLGEYIATITVPSVYDMFKQSSRNTVSTAAVDEAFHSVDELHLWVEEVYRTAHNQNETGFYEPDPAPFMGVEFFRALQACFFIPNNYSGLKRLEKLGVFKQAS